MRRTIIYPTLVATLISGCAGLPQQTPESTTAASVKEVADALGLEKHVEGGYFRRTYESDHRAMINTEGGERFLMTSIFYMLTESSPIGHFHLNKSDIVHYHHKGDPIRYYLIHPDGKLETMVLGQDIRSGEQLQLKVPGGIWKASELLDGSHGYGLISEAVSPGFDYEDMTLGTEKELMAKFPEHASLFDRLTRK